MYGELKHSGYDAFRMLAGDPTSGFRYMSDSTVRSTWTVKNLAIVAFTPIQWEGWTVLIQCIDHDWVAGEWSEIAIYYVAR